MSIATPEKILDLAVTYSGGRYHLESLFSSFPKLSDYIISYSLLINTDNEADVTYARQASQLLPNINIIVSDKKNSPLKSRSILSQQSVAHYIWFIDDDDELKTNQFHRIYEELQSKKFDWLQINMILDSGKKIASSAGIFNNQQTKDIYCHNYIHDTVFITPHMANKIYRRETANKTFASLKNLDLYLLEDDYFNSCFIHLNSNSILKISESICYKYFRSRSIVGRKRNYGSLHYQSLVFVLSENLRMDIASQSGRNVAGFIKKLIPTYDFKKILTSCAVSNSQKFTYLKIISCFFYPSLLLRLNWRRDLILFSNIIRREILRFVQAKPN